MKIIIAPDSFKGVLTALEAATCIERGIRKGYGDCDILKVPMADGGEGTVQAMVDATGGNVITADVTGPTGRKVNACFGMLGDKRTAVIEMAAASGLPLIGAGEMNPLKTTSYGTGELILRALDKGSKRIVIGIGGSATVDGGIGMAQALGVKFLAADGKEIEGNGGGLRELNKIDISDLRTEAAELEVIVACDVDNPLLGDDGAARVYAPQKGAGPDDVEMLEKGMRNYSRVIRNDTGKMVSEIPGAGAAGGLGAGLIAFLNASLRQGIEVVIDVVGLKEKIKGSNLVITGEGQLDYQTVFGKTPAGVAKVASGFKKPVIAIGGQTGKDAWKIHSSGINAYFSALTMSMDEKTIMEKGAEMLEECSEEIGRVMKIGESWK